MIKKKQYKIIIIAIFILFAFFILVNKKNVFAEGIIKEKNVLQEEVNDIDDISQLIKKVFINHDYEENFYYKALDNYSRKNYLVIKKTFLNQLEKNFNDYYEKDEKNGEIVHQYLIKFTLDHVPDPSRLLNVSFLFLEIHKELFFLSGNNNISVSKTYIGKGEVSISFGIINDYTNDNFKTLKEDLKYFYINFNHLASTANHLNDYEKILYFHDWLIYHNEYNENAIRPENEKKFDTIISHTPISALKHEYSPVCEGYSELYYLFLTASGVRNIYITGDAFSNGGSESHAWNYVFLNNKYYLVDTTWDDPMLSEPKKEFISYKYFLIGSENNKTHIPEEYYPFTNDKKEKKRKILYPNLSLENYETFIEDYSISKHFENPFPYLVKEFDGKPIDPFVNFSYKNDYNIKIINANTGENLDELPKEIGYYIFILTPKDKKYYQRSHLSFYTKITNPQVIPNISKDIYILNGKSASYTDKISLESNKKLPNISANTTLNELITLIKNTEINTDFIGYKFLTIAVNGSFYDKSNFDAKLKDLFPNMDTETIFNINLIYEENYVKLTLSEGIDIILPEKLDTNNIPVNQEIKLKINIPKNSKLDSFIINGDSILLSGDEYIFTIKEDTTITASFKEIKKIIIKDENGNNYPLNMNTDNPKTSDFLNHIPKTNENDIIIGYKIGDNFITNDTKIESYDNIVISTINTDKLFINNDKLEYKDNKIIVKKDGLLTRDDISLNENFIIENITKNDDNTLTFQIKSKHLNNSQTLTIPFSDVKRPIKKDNNNKIIIIGVLGAIGFLLIITVFAIVSKSRKRK